MLLTYHAMNQSRNPLIYVIVMSDKMFMSRFYPQLHFMPTEPCECDLRVAGPLVPGTTYWADRPDPPQTCLTLRSTPLTT